jgi:excisionase family DNA binding protein
MRAQCLNTRPIAPWRCLNSNPAYPYGVRVRPCFTVPHNSRSYTTIEVAKRLGVSLQTVQRWVDAGQLKAWKTLGGHRRIDAESAELLFKAQEDQIGSLPPELPPEPAPVTAVIVDDNHMDRELLTFLVRKALPHARIEVAENGFQGLVTIGRVSPDIVITDINMPHMNGLEMIRNLLSDTAIRPRTLVAISSLSKQGLAELGSLPPGVLFLRKPLEERLLIAALQQ